jgi:hypothetical protein
MVSNTGNPPPDVTRIAATGHLGQCTSVHKIGGALTIMSIAAIAVVAITAFLVSGVTSIANSVASAFSCLGMICATVFLVAGLVHIGEAVYVYEEGLVYVDRTSVTAIRFDEIRSIERISRYSPEAMAGRVSYRIAGGGYSVRVSGFVDDSATLGLRLEDAVRRHGGLIT